MIKKLSIWDRKKILIIFFSCLIIPVGLILLFYLFLGYYKPTVSDFFILNLELHIAVIEGLALGVIVSVVEVYVSKTLFRRTKIWKRFLIKIMFFSIIIRGVTYLSGSYYLSQQSQVFIDEFLLDLYGYQILTGFLYSLISHLLAVSIALALVELNFFFGNNFTNVLIGKYQSPKEENNVFLFLNLKRSTDIAEKIGHKRYGQLIQDCFFDLSGSLVKHKARIYRFVGDEVVLNWELSKHPKLQLEDIIGTLASFQAKLNDQSVHYLKKYNEVPVFTGGAHVGVTTVVEVGEFKREIVYHGNVVKITSKLGQLCDSMGKQFIISKGLLETLLTTEKYKLNELGETHISDKSDPITIYEVEV